MAKTTEILPETIEHMRAQLPAEVARLDVETGHDSEGEHAAWVWIVMRAEAPEEAWAWENRERMRDKVRQMVKDLDLFEWVYVRFRGEDEDPTPPVW